MNLREYSAIKKVIEDYEKAKQSHIECIKEELREMYGFEITCGLSRTPEKPEFCVELRNGKQMLGFSSNNESLDMWKNILDTVKRIKEMEREGIKKHKEVFEAWLEGAEVQFKNLDNEWEDTKAPIFDTHMEYRVKPNTDLLRDRATLRIKRRLDHDPNGTEIGIAKLTFTAKLVPDRGHLKTMYTPKLYKDGIEILPVVPFSLLGRPEVSSEELEAHFELVFQKVSCR